MDRRAWLVERGLAKPGKGKLSHAAHEAWNRAVAAGEVEETVEPVKSTRAVKANVKPIAKPITESKPVQKRTIDKVRASLTLNSTKLRDNTMFWGIDKAKQSSQKDILIAFQVCYGCNKTVQYCTHELPQLPNWINNSEKNGMLVNPHV